MCKTNQKSLAYVAADAAMSWLSAEVILWTNSKTW